MLDKCQGCDAIALVETCHAIPSWGFCRTCQAFAVRTAAEVKVFSVAEIYNNIRNLNAKIDELRVRQVFAK